MNEQLTETTVEQKAQKKRRRPNKSANKTVSNDKTIETVVSTEINKIADAAKSEVPVVKETISQKIKSVFYKIKVFVKGLFRK